MGVVSLRWHRVHMRAGFPRPRSSCRCSKTPTHTPSQCALCEDMCVCDQTQMVPPPGLSPRQLFRALSQPPQRGPAACPPPDASLPPSHMALPSVGRGVEDWRSLDRSWTGNCRHWGRYPPVSEHLWQSRAAVGSPPFPFGVQRVPSWPGSDFRGPGAPLSLTYSLLTACQASELSILSMREDAVFL